MEGNKINVTTPYTARNEEKARQDEKKKQKQQIKKLTFDMDDEEEDEEDEDDEACGGGQGDIKKDPDAPEPSTSVRELILHFILFFILQNYYVHLMKRKLFVSYAVGDVYGCREVRREEEAWEEPRRRHKLSPRCGQGIWHAAFT